MTMLTLFADASFCPKTGAAGWGSWAIKDGWPKGLFHGGALRREIKSSNEAELCGLASALWVHDKAGNLGDVTAFILQCDNTVALGTILSLIPQAGHVSSKKRATNAQIAARKNGIKPIEHEAIEAITGIVAGRPIWLKHVKGHNGNSDGRSWVNNQCDDAARRHMRARRQEILEAMA